MGAADPIQTRPEFFNQLARATETTKRLLVKRADKREILDDIELQLDVMARRAADPAGPTPEEQQRIHLASLVKMHFAPGPNGLNLDPETGIWSKQLRNLEFYYKHWPAG